MPDHKFRCRNGHTHDRTYPIGKAKQEVRCKHCRLRAVRLYSVPAVRFVGPGFTKTAA